MLIKIDGHVMGVIGELSENELSEKFMEFMETNGWSFMGSIIKDDVPEIITQEMTITKDTYDDSEIIDNANSIKYLMSLQEQYYAAGDYPKHAECWKKINELLEGPGDVL